MASGVGYLFLLDWMGIRAPVWIIYIVISISLISTLALLNVDFSDHFPVFAITTEELPPNNHELSRLSLSLMRLKERIRRQNWNQILELQDPNSAYDLFLNAIQHCIYKAQVIKRNKYSTPYKPWITSGILLSIKTKDSLFKFVRKHPSNQVLLNEYKQYRNKLTKILKVAKYNYFNDRLNNCQGNVKEIWKTLNFALNKSHNSTELNCIQIKENGENKLIYDSKHIVDILNSHFLAPGRCTNTTHHNSNIDCILNKINNPKSIYLKPVTNSEIMNHINSLKSKTPSFNGA